MKKGAQGAISKRKERIILRQGPLFGERDWRGILSCRPPLLFMGNGENTCDRLLVLPQKIPDWLIKFAFLGKGETAIGSGIKSRFSIITFRTTDTIWGLWFFSLTVVILS